MATTSLENTHQERLCSSNWPTEFDMVGKSCLYETSSFQRTASYHKRGSKGASSASEYLMDSPSYSKKESKGASKAQSQEMRLTSKESPLLHPQNIQWVQHLMGVIPLMRKFPVSM